MHDEDDDDVEYIEQSFTDEEEDDNLLEEFNDPLRSRFLVYEAEYENHKFDSKVSKIIKNLSF